MDKKTKIAIGVIASVVALAGVFLFFSPRKSDNEAKTDTSNYSVKDQETTRPAAAGTYVEYVSGALDTATHKQRLLFFHASWCPQCRELDASIKATSLPEDLIIYKVDYDSHQDLRMRYGVTLQTTVVKIDEGSNKIKSFVAYDTPSYAMVEKELLR